jgi:hypothetical protein
MEFELFMLKKLYKSIKMQKKLLFSFFFIQKHKNAEKNHYFRFSSCFDIKMQKKLLFSVFFMFGHKNAEKTTFFSFFPDFK